MPNEELRRLVQRSGLREKLRDPDYAAGLVFITNAPLDAAGRDYAKSYAGHTPPLTIWDRDRIASVAERTRSLAVQPLNVTLPIASDLIRERLDESASLSVAMIPATELVRLPGIEDASIFELNVLLTARRPRAEQRLPHSSTHLPRTRRSC